MEDEPEAAVSVRVNAILYPLLIPSLTRDTPSLKSLVIYGANASGKSNILKALRFF